MDADYSLPRFRTVEFFIRFGTAIALAIAATIAGAAIAATVAGAPWWSAVGGVLAALLAGALLQSYVEVLKIVHETLVPK